MCTATYLSSASDDATGALAVDQQGAIFYAGPLPASASLKHPLDGATGEGGLLKLSPSGRVVAAAAQLGRVRGLAIMPNGDAVVSVGADLHRLTSDLTSVVWTHKAVGEAVRLRAGSDGTIVHQTSNALFVRDQDGKELAKLGATGVADVVVDGKSKRLFVTGFKQDDGAPCTQLQIPFLNALDYTGAVQWKAYGWTRQQVGAVDECADSRGLALAIGGDGKLYYAGESHGGNTVHRRMPDDLAQMAPNQKPDKYADPYNLNGAAPVGYVARFEPKSGRFETGTFILGRLTSGKGNAARPSALAADDKGHVLVGGSAACCIDQAEARTVRGMPAMPAGTYAGGGFALVLSPDLSQRLTWTTWNGPKGGGATPVSVFAGAGAMGILLAHAPSADGKAVATTTQPLLTVDALVPAPPGGSGDLLLSVWRGP